MMPWRSIVEKRADDRSPSVPQSFVVLSVWRTTSKPCPLSSLADVPIFSLEIGRSPSQLITADCGLMMIDTVRIDADLIK
ncbi:hypothetical protein CEXT_691301 [Caerostris extrusa]|uniref:Uncharacterized protein n=1 Tax=Caerostris extrusa TaxID=172846 RepID=A0AAV4XDT4_CAEEX|nr:hypothetical protein CEXT_691301 [Caerostris extrusa]